MSAGVLPPKYPCAAERSCASLGVPAGPLGVNCKRFQTTAAHMYLTGKAFGDKCASQDYNSEEFQ